MAPQDQKQAGLHDSGIGWAIILAILFLVFLMFWRYFQYPIKNAFRWYRYGEMKLIGLFVSDSYTAPWQGQPQGYHDATKAIAAVPMDHLTGDVMDYISTVGLYPIKYLFLAAFGVMGAWAFLFGPSTQYRRKLDLSGLIRAQAKNFPVIAPFVKFNPQNQPARPPGAPVPSDLPAFAEALSPEEWVAHNELPAPDGKVDTQAAFMAFADQLGGRWEGALKLAPYKQVLLAAFCLKAARKRNEADDLLGRLANCWSLEQGLKLSHDRALLGEALKVLRSRDLAEKTLAKCNQHAFETTALLRGLLTAREEGGVLAPASFVWLRAHDRRLWYPLNNLGRQAFHMEALGGMCHFKAERLTRRPIPRPKVQDAVKSITEYMRSPRARPIPPLDYGKSKRGVKKPA